MGGVAVNCMKCGRETQADAVFCEDCLDHMERHPVPPNMLVYVPSEKDRHSVKKHGTGTPIITAEDQIKHLNKKIHSQRLVIALFFCVIMFLTLLSMDVVHELNVSKFAGKNYTSITSSATVD